MQETPPSTARPPAPKQAHSQHDHTGHDHAGHDHSHHDQAHHDHAHNGHEHGDHAHHDHGHEARPAGAALNRLAFSATLHCLTGCATGEVLGLVIGTALGWSTFATIALAVALAFLFGYALTMLPLLRHGLAFGTALGLALASDTLSVTTMEIVDNLIILVIPGAMDAGLASPLFWGSLAVALIIAGVAAFPVNRYLIARGRGHAVVHKYHGHHH